MARYLLPKILTAVVTLLVVSALTFGMVHLTSGDPVNLVVPPTASPEVRQRAYVMLGLDQPPAQQYINYMKRAVRGDFGTSIRTNQPVSKIISDRLGRTLQLGGAGLGLSMIVGISLGFIAAVKRGTWLDSSSLATAATTMAVPPFWLGLLLIYVFAVQLRWLPPSQAGTWKHLVLPAVTLATESVGSFILLTRAAVLDAIRQPFTVTFTAWGFSRWRIMFVHVFRNALLPIISLIGVRMGWLIAGAIMVEAVFSWPGLGRTLVDHILVNDYPVVQGVVLLMTLVVVLSNLAADVLHAVVDPRIRR